MQPAVRYSLMCIVALLNVCIPDTATCAEGLWIPEAKSSPNLADSLRKSGIQINPFELFSGNANTLTSAVAQLSTGCTASIISHNGLALTNYHCLLKYIPALSNPDSLIKKGFYAHSQDQELPLKGLNVEITHHIIDLTDSITRLLATTENFLIKKKLADSICLSLEKQYAQTTGYVARVESSMHLTQFHVYLVEVFSDIRLAFLPPEFINFGQATENWQWPRHAADFAFIRMYKNGKAYSSNAYIPIAQKHAIEHDFAMLIGFPTETTNHLSSAGLGYLIDSIVPVLKNCYDYKSKIIAEASNRDPLVRNIYTNKLYEARNIATKYDGAYQMLKHSDARGQRYTDEQILATKDSIIALTLNELYAKEQVLSTLNKQSTILLHSIFSSDLFLGAIKLRKLQARSNDFAKTQATVLQQVATIFNKADLQAETEIAMTSFEYYIENTDKFFLPKSLKDLYKETARSYFRDILKRSALTDLDKLSHRIIEYHQGKNNALDTDPLFILANDIYSAYLFRLQPIQFKLNNSVDSLYYEYFRRMRQLTDKTLYPDADATLRLSYGYIHGSEPADGVLYKWKSSKRGYGEKNTQDSVSYPLPADFLTYISDNLPEDQTICFTTTCHSSGGNSGSPVLNSRGEMIGLNFDRIWQATMSDYYYSESMCRNIAVDMSYIMHLLDNYFKANALSQEIRDTK